MTANVVTDALSMAWFRRNLGDDVIFHNNRGWQHDKQAMAAKVTDFGEAASVSRKCHCWDNASSESFLDSLKNERVHGATHAMRADAQANLFDHIEVFYKRSHRHSAPG
jgi:transposase InsO family protein